METNIKQALIPEYEANIALWQHDDSLRQQRIGNFLTVNTVLLAAIAAVVAFKPAVPYIAGLLILFSLFGVVFSFVSYRIQRRNSEYVRFRRYQLRSIEVRLSDYTTFRNTQTAFEQGNPVSFQGINEQFVIKPKARNSSTETENKLPVCIGILWVIVLLFASLLLVFHCITPHSPKPLANTSGPQSHYGTCLSGLSAGHPKMRPSSSVRLRACAKINWHFRIPSSGHLWPILIRQKLEIERLFLRFGSIGSTKSDLNLSANSTNLFLRKPLGDIAAQIDSSALLSLSNNRNPQTMLNLYGGFSD